MSKSFLIVSLYYLYMTDGDTQVRTNLRKDVGNIFIDLLIILFRKNEETEFR